MKDMSDLTLREIVKDLHKQRVCHCRKAALHWVARISAHLTDRASDFILDYLFLLVFC